MDQALLRTSERAYAFLLKLYPKSYQQEFGPEMQFVFSEQLADLYRENGDRRLVILWARTIIDAGQSIIRQHVEHQIGGNSMGNDTDIIMQNRVFIWIALATVLILLAPLVAMQFTAGVNWDATDFIVMGTLLFGTGSVFVLAARKNRNHMHRIVIGLALAAAFLWLWIELAVGLFTNWGS